MNYNLDLVQYNEPGGKVDDYINSIISYLDLWVFDGDLVIEYESLGEISLYGFSYGDRDRCELRINKGLVLSDLVTTLCHELTHARQFLSGDLQYHGSETFWRGMRYERRGEDTPWEIEARSNEMKIPLFLFEHHPELRDAYKYS